MSGQPRESAGVPTGGQFTGRLRVETGTELTTADDRRSAFVLRRNGRDIPLVMAPGLAGSTAGLPVHRPAGWAPFGDERDRAVRSVADDGVLCRGPVGHEQAAALRSWRAFIEQRADLHRIDDPELAAAYDEFTAGLEHGVIALMSSTADVSPSYVVSRLTWQLGSRPRRGNFEHARRLLTQKRTSKASRAEWALMVQQAPSPAAQRGYVTAGLVLSGLDDWWGLRDDPARTVTGATPDSPHTI